MASAITLLLLLGSVRRLKASGNMPASRDPAMAAKGKRAGILFGIVFGIESGAIGLTSALLARLGLGDWIPVAVALIVGLHFLPLAHVFEYPLYYWTGIVSCLGILGCLFLPEMGVRLLCVGLWMAGVLWLTALVLLVRTRAGGSKHA